jgi:ethanolamine ammonia-lyase large subunit
MQERHASIASEALDRVVERLKSIQSEELTPADTAKWLEVATKIERLSRGEPTEIGKQELSGQVINKHEYDVTEAIERYADVYRQLEGRSILQSSNASNDSREPVDSAQADVETS